MIETLREQGLKETCQRAIVEQFLSSHPDIYSAEDDRFLYYAEESEAIRIFHIVKGKFDYAMEINDWESFAKMMLEVDDDFFVSGLGKDFRDCFLGNYLSKYDRRKDFITDLIFVIDDAKDWLNG